MINLCKIVHYIFLIEIYLLKNMVIKNLELI